jgi:hypothetical protein
MTKPNLATLIRGFFEKHLVSARGLSEHTVLAYRDAWKLSSPSPAIIFAKQARP